MLQLLYSWEKSPQQYILDMRLGGHECEEKTSCVPARNQKTLVVWPIGSRNDWPLLAFMTWCLVTREVLPLLYITYSVS